MNVDVTAFKEGWHGDTSRMFKVGEVSVKAEKLIQTTYEAMMKAIEVVKDGVLLGDIGSAIQSHVEVKWIFSCSRFLWTWNWTIISSRTECPSLW